MPYRIIYSLQIDLPPGPGGELRLLIAPLKPDGTATNIQPVPPKSWDKGATHCFFLVVVACSIAGGHNRVEESKYTQRPIGKYYLSSGTREKPFCRTGRALAEILDKYGVEHVHTERCAGHAFSFWESKLPEAIRWSFPPRRPTWLRRLRDLLS